MRVAVVMPVGVALLQKRMFFLASNDVSAFSLLEEDLTFRNGLLRTSSGEYLYDDGYRTYAEKTYLSHDFISYQQANEKGLYVEYEHLNFISQWAVKHGEVRIFNVRYSDGTNESLMTDRILSIDEVEAVFRSLDDGEVFTRTRIG